MLQIQGINPDIRIGILDLEQFAGSREIATGREAERSGTFLLISELCGADKSRLEYSASGKPYIRDFQGHISISHSHRYLAMILNSKEETGIDIELIRDKALRVRHKFLNPSEALFAGDDTERHILLWAAKEALYKVHGKGNLSFIKDIGVEAMADQQLHGTVRSAGRSRNFRLQSQITGEYCLVYVLHEIR